VRTLAALLLLLSTSDILAADWPQFRGPGSLGIGEGPEPPVQFGTNANLLWKTSLPAGHSSPCIWGNRIFLTSIENKRLETLCLDRTSGTILWRKTAPTEKIEPAHRIANPAAATCATDGQTVFTYFGSFGILAYDLAGQERWQLPLPPPMVEFGTGTSPLIAGELLILARDQDQGSHLVALDKSTGKTVWRVERPEFRRSFSTPLVWKHDNVEELIVPGSIWLTSYNLKDGSERWRYNGTSRVANSTPVVGDGLLFNASWNVGGDDSDRISMPPFEGFIQENDKDKDGMLTREEIPAGPVRDRFTQLDLNKDGKVTAAEWATMAEMFAKAENALLAIRPGGTGNITKTHVAWKSTRSLPYVSSPLYHQGRLYTVKNGGLLSCYEAKTGKVIYQDERVDAGGDYYASAVAVGNKIYIASQKGVVSVIAPGDKLDVLARNDLGEEIFATPAVVNGVLYVRTASGLSAFAASQR
jgi:outer membrane protein assembly factor BamB